MPFSGVRMHFTHHTTVLLVYLQIQHCGQCYDGVVSLPPHLQDLCSQCHLHILDIIVGHTGILHSIQSLDQSFQLCISYRQLVQNHRPNCSGIRHSNHLQWVLTLDCLLSSMNTSPHQSIGVGVNFDLTKLMMCNPCHRVDKILVVKVVKSLLRVSSLCMLEYLSLCRIWTINGRPGELDET
jgi:hypothetical protein